jgi:hypothetical protein
MGGGVAAAHEGVIFHSLLFSCWLVVGCSSNQEHACRHYGPCLTVLVGYKKRIEMIERNNEYTCYVINPKDFGYNNIIMHIGSQILLHVELKWQK